MNDHDEKSHDETSGVRDQGGRLSGREVAFAARDALGFMEALWIGDKKRAQLIYSGASEQEREAIAQSLASIALTALRTPENTPPGRFVGVLQALLEDGVNAIDGAGR